MILLSEINRWLVKISGVFPYSTLMVRWMVDGPGRALYYAPLIDYRKH
jgi:hypothetical protein